MAQVKEVRGPGPRGAGQPRPKVENPGLLLKRIMGEVFQHYLPHCIFVLVCIVVSALANVQASLFLKTLIDDYIVPMTQQATPDFGPLAAALGRIGCVYAVDQTGRMRVAEVRLPAPPRPPAAPPAAPQNDPQSTGQPGR